MLRDLYNVFVLSCLVQGNQFTTHCIVVCYNCVFSVEICLYEYTFFMDDFYKNVVLFYMVFKVEIGSHSHVGGGTIHCTEHSVLTL